MTPTNTPITTLDAKSHDMLLKEAKAALQTVAEKYGLTIRQEGMSTRDHAGTFAKVKYIITVAQQEGQGPVGVDALAYTRYAASEGLDPAWLGKTLTHPTEGELEVVGFRPRAKKNPVVVKNARNGKNYVYTIDGIKQLAKLAGWPLPAHWSNDPKYIAVIDSFKKKV